MSRNAADMKPSKRTEYPRMMSSTASVSFHITTLYHPENVPPETGKGLYEWFMEKKAELEKMYPKATIELTAHLENRED